MNIGDWVRRSRGGGKWHVVESVVAEDAVTRCGRRMDWATRSGGQLQVSDVMPLTRMIGQPQNCRFCDFVPAAILDATAAPEGDASTHADDTP